MSIRCVSYFLGILLGITCQSLAVAAPSTEQFISISDIHFNPFSSCKTSPRPCHTVEKLRTANYHDWDTIFIQDGEEQLAKSGEETNYPLFASTLETLQELEQEKHPAFGLVLGDLLAHDFHARYIAYSHDFSMKGYEEFVHKTFEFMTYKLHEAMPNLDIYGVIGNNDSYDGDYNTTSNGQFFADTAKMWANLTHQPNNKRELLKDFPLAGYYAVTLSDKHTRLIVLNTVLFSSRALGKGSDLAANQELAWLHQQLLLAKEEKLHVLLALHIPPGIDVHNTVKTAFGNVKEFWQPAYQKVFMKELQNNGSLIIGILSGHLHMDAAQLIEGQQVTLPVSFTPGISPLFGNNPGFKLYSMDSAFGILKDFDTYYLPKHAVLGWKKEYSFNETYQPDCKQCDLTSGIQTITAVNAQSQYYRQYYAVSNNAGPIMEAKYWSAYWCDLHEINADRYQQCTNEIKLMG